MPGFYGGYSRTQAIPASTGQHAESNASRSIVLIEVDETDPLPGAEQKATVLDRDGQRGAGEHREQVVGAVAPAAVAVGPAVVAGQQAARRTAGNPDSSRALGLLGRVAVLRALL